MGTKAEDSEGRARLARRETEDVKDLGFLWWRSCSEVPAQAVSVLLHRE